MSRIDDIAASLFGGRRVEESAIEASSQTYTITGTASTASEDGSVWVRLSDDVTRDESMDVPEAVDGTALQLPTTVNVVSGDEVIVTVYGGTISSMVVTGIVGRGDEVNDRISAIEADYVKADVLEANYAHITDGVIDNATIGYADVDGLSANYATIANLNAATARIDSVEADTAKIHNLTAEQLSAATAYIASLNADDITAASLAADVAKIHDLTAQQLSAAAAYIATLVAGSVTAQSIIADHGDFATVKANAAKVANLTAAELEADHATIASLDTDYAQINLANVNNAWIENGTVKNAAIRDGMIQSVGANKLTAGTIDASNINVTNLRASSLIVDKLNGQPVLGGYTYVSKNSSGYASKNPKALGWYELTANGFAKTNDTSVNDTKTYYTSGESTKLYDQDYIDDLEEGLSQRIDGAIETFTTDTIPTLNNYPASDWTTDKAKSAHVGDICYVINEGAAGDGWCYRFAYDNTTSQYVWVLIRDSDVTSALSRIDDLETFETTTNTWKTNTDREISTLQSEQTNLSGRMTTAEGTLETKVDTTTFNQVSQTVDANSSSITQLTTTTTQLRADVDGIEIGGRNLLLATAGGDTTNGSTSQSVYTKAWTISDYGQSVMDNTDDVFTWSFDYEVTGNEATGAFIYAQIRGSAIAYTDVHGVPRPQDVYENTTGHYSRSVRLTSTQVSSATQSCRIRLQSATDGAVLHVWNVKIEKGTKGSDWTAAPEDLESTVTTVSNKVSEHTQTIEGFTTRIGSLETTIETKADSSTVETVSNRLNTVSDTVDGHTSQLGRVQTRVENSDPNMLLDWNAPSLTKVDAKINRYFSNVSNVEVTPAFFEVADPPMVGIENGVRFVCDGTQTGARGRALSFYNESSSTALAFVDGQAYTASWWARRTDGGGETYVSYVNGGTDTTKNNGVHALTSEWQHFTDTFKPARNTSHGSRVWFFSRFGAGVAGTVELCGFKLVPGESAENVATTVTTLSNDYAEYKQTTEEFKTTVGTTYATKTELKGATDDITELESRVSTTETSIQQNRDAITLRATKTEAYQVAQPNLTPWFNVEPYTTAAGYWYRVVADELTSLGDGWVHISKNNTDSSTAFVNYFIASRGMPTDLKPSTNYTFLVEKKNIVRDTSVTGYTLIVTGSYSSEVDAFSVSVSGNFDEGVQYLQRTTKSDLSAAKLFTRGYISVPAGGSVEMDLRISLYEGEYTGPYKPYTGPQLYATNSELKVTADGISSTVERIGGFKYLESASAGASLSNIKTYAADGRVGNWSVKSTNDVRVGDFIYLKYKDTTRNCDIYVKGKVLALNSSTNINLESHGYEDVLPVETIKSTINQSADSVKIQAKHIEIDGTAIFNNTDFKQAADAAYDAKGAATTAENNAKSYADNIEVGGRNLLAWSGSSGEETPSMRDLSWTHSNDGWITVTGTQSLSTNGILLLWGITPTYPYLFPAGAYTITVENDGLLVANILRAQIYYDSTYDYLDDSGSLTFTAKNGVRRVCIWFDGSSGGTTINGRIRFKLERGNRATDWTPAPEDVANDISASVVGQGGFTILWNYSNFTTSNNGEAYVCALDPLTNQTSDADGWAMWNGVRRTIPKGMINPNAVIPFRIPIYVVCRLSSADATTGTFYLVWYDDGWKWSNRSPSAVGGNFAWTEATDMVLGTFVMTSAEGAISETVVFRTPWSSKQVTTSTVTANSAQNLANTANNTANAAAPKANAVARSQRIYYRKTSSGAPSANTTWLATSGTGYGNWSLNVPQLTNNGTKYPYLYTAVQTQTVAQQAAGTTCSCSAVLIDDSSTVIDGGNIITGTVSANAINAKSGTFDTANIPALTADHIKANVISAVNNGTGTINADKINVSSITIGYDQIDDDTKPTIPSTVAELSDASDYAKQSALTTEINQRKAAYATSSTAAGSRGKVANCANFALYTGASVTVTFSNANTHATPTLNVNSTGAKSIRGYTGAALTAAEYKWAAGAAITFVYDGSYWRMQDSGAQQAKADAASSASAASTSATNAATSASNASTSATNAANSASTASTKAGEASTSATNAANSASTASSKATDASNSASAASTSATNAANSATSASNFASSASTSATNAATSATKALDAAAGWYAECSTDGATTAKVATITPATTNFTLTKGVVVHVKFSNLNSGAAGSLTLNVNSTGAKSIKYVSSGGTIANLANANWLRANVTYEFYYDGTYWIAQQSYNTNNYDRENYKAELAASAAISSGRIAVLGTDRKLKLLNASAFDYSGPILYVATAYSADDVSSGTKRTTNYTFWGTTFTLTNTHAVANAAAGSAVYIVGTVSGKIFTPNSTVLTCKVPTTKDNLVYIRLGLMSSTTAAVLEADHPMYMFFDGAFQQCDAATANAACTATNYITHVDNNGITIHPQSGTSNRVAINANGMEVYKDNVSVASYGDTTRIGQTDAGHIDIDSTGILITPDSTAATPVIIASSEADAGKTSILADYVSAASSISCGSVFTNLLNIGGTKSIEGINFGFSSASTNANGITTFNPGLGVAPTAVFVAPGKASTETEAVAKIAVPMVWSIDSATQVQVRWQRSDTNAWLASNTVGWYWLALYSS